MNLLRRHITLGMLAWTAAASMAFAHDMAGHHGMHIEQALGTSAAVDHEGRLWIARTEPAAGEPAGLAFVVVQMSSDMGKTWSAPRRVQRVPEAIEASGESRPKLAFGAKGQIYISYTRPLAKPYTGEIRFVRSLDGGRSFSPPLTVHKNRALITHRFDSMIVDPAGRVFIAWIDKRDAEAARARKQTYRGAAVYYAVSDDAGASFKGDFKLAEHSCECCRIALALAPDGKVVALWRNVFEPNVRDHALAALAVDGVSSAPLRATFDDWRIDACPHHGPALAYGADGTRHQVWFDVKGEEGGVFYASTSASGELRAPMRLGSAQAEHGEVAVQGRHVVLAWKQFDGEATAIMCKVSADGGLTWRDLTLAKTQGNSDHPHLVQTATGIVLVWRTQDQGIQTIPL